MKKLITLLLALLLASTMLGQTTDTTTKNTVLATPSYLMGGLSYNQYTGGSAFVSAIVPELKSAGVFASITADLVPTKVVDPKTNKNIWLLSASTRFGQHKQLYWDGKNMLLFGGDIGPSFSQENTATPLTTTSGTTFNIGGTQIGLSGSFTVTYARQFSKHWGVAFPIRMLWQSGVGPEGKGAWNPVAQVAIVYDFKGSGK